MHLFLRISIALTNCHFATMSRMELICNNTLFSSLVSFEYTRQFCLLIVFECIWVFNGVWLFITSFFFWLHRCTMLWRFFGWRTWHFHCALHMSSTSTSCVTCMFTIWHCVPTTCFLWVHSAHDTPRFWLLYFICKNLNVCTMDTYFHFNNFYFFECLTMCIIYIFFC